MRHPEFALQCQLAQVLQYANPGVIWWHTPNEGVRSKGVGGRLKAAGMKAGVSDFLFVLPPAGRLAALEIKAHGGKCTELQTAFLNQVVSAGGLAAWCNNFDEAVAILRAWQVIR